MKFLAFRQRVTDLEVTRVVKTHDVTGVRLVDDGFLGRHERRGGGELEVFAQTDVQVVGVTPEHAGTHFHESDTVAVVGVHVGVDLEDKTGEFFLVRLHETFVRLAGSGLGAISMKQSSISRIPKLFNADPKNTGPVVRQGTPPGRWRGILPERVRGLPATCRPSAHRYARRVRRS